MANTLTSLAADIYRNVDQVGRELTGLVTSVTINKGSERAAVGDTIRASKTRPATSETIVPSMTLPEGTDITVDNETFTFTNQKSVKIPITGEDQRHLDNGAGWEAVYGDLLRQALRTLVNEIELHTWNMARAGCSRAYGTPGTNPFASNFNSLNFVSQILSDNGAPVADGAVSAVFNTTAGVAMRNLTQLQGVNTSGNDTLLRQGTLLNLSGMMMKESAAPSAVTKGTGTSYTSNTAGYAKGATSITLITGSGTILAGDTVTFAGDTNKYVVKTGISAPGTIVLNAPGLRQALPTSAVALTVGATATPNIVLHQSSMELAMRPFLKPYGGDAAVETMDISDDRTPLSFNLSKYVGYNKAFYDVSCVYGAKVWNPPFIAQLLG